MRRLLSTLAPTAEKVQRRLFPVLAVIAVVALVAWLVRTLGFGIGLEPIDFASISAVLLAHGLATQYLFWVGSLIRFEARSVGLPEWVEAQAEKNLGKGVLTAGIALALHFVVLWCSMRERVSGLWLAGLMAGNLALQIGVFVGEFMVIQTQGRLFREVRGWARTPEGALANREI